MLAAPWEAGVHVWNAGHHWSQLGPHCVCALAACCSVVHQSLWSSCTRSPPALFWVGASCSSIPGGIWAAVQVGLRSSVVVGGGGGLRAELGASARSAAWNWGASMPWGRSPCVGEKRWTAPFFCHALQPLLSVQISWVIPTWKSKEMLVAEGRGQNNSSVDP